MYLPDRGAAPKLLAAPRPSPDRSRPARPRRGCTHSRRRIHVGTPQNPSAGIEPMKLSWQMMPNAMSNEHENGPNQMVSRAVPPSKLGQDLNLRPLGCELKFAYPVIGHMENSGLDQALYVPPNGARGRLVVSDAMLWREFPVTFRSVDMADHDASDQNLVGASGCNKPTRFWSQHIPGNRSFIHRQVPSTPHRHATDPALGQPVDSANLVTSPLLRFGQRSQSGFGLHRSGDLIRLTVCVMNRDRLGGTIER